MLNLEFAVAALNPASTLSTINIKIGALAFRAWLWIMFFHDPSPSAAGLSAAPTDFSTFKICCS